MKKVSKTTKKIFGTINEDVAFTINYRKVNANNNGEFEFLLPLNQNQIFINFGNKKVLKDVSLNSMQKETIIAQVEEES